jgi:hypothetical protein
MDRLSSQIMIRPSDGDDHRALIRLAALDSAAGVPPAPVLVAEVDGELQVALSLRDGTVIADPFRPTAEIVTLLRAHSGAARTPRTRRRPLQLSLARG